MTQYEVVITETALAQVREYARFIAVECGAPETAARWLQRVLAAGETLSETPRRCARAPEDAYRSYEIRWLGIGEYMLLFTVIDADETVWILAARHGRRLPQTEDLPDLPMDDP